jgi:hypothetical protein
MHLVFVITLCALISLVTAWSSHFKVPKTTGLPLLESVYDEQKLLQLAATLFNEIYNSNFPIAIKFE